MKSLQTFCPGDSMIVIDAMVKSRVVRKPNGRLTFFHVFQI